MLCHFDVCNITDSTGLDIIQHSPQYIYSLSVAVHYYDIVDDIPKELFLFVSYLYKWKYVPLNPHHQIRSPPFPSGNHHSGLRSLFGFVCLENRLFMALISQTHTSTTASQNSL